MATTLQDGSRLFPVVIPGPGSSTAAPAALEPAAVRSVHAAGRTAAAALRPIRHPRAVYANLRRTTRAVRRALYSGLAQSPPSPLHQDWLVGNARLIVTIEKELRVFAGDTVGLPAVEGRAPTLRVCALAEAFLQLVEWRFDEESFVAFMTGAQETNDLQMGELWAAKPALQLAILQRIIYAATSARADLPVLITGLRVLAECQWKYVFAALNPVDPILATDPAGAYAAMDDDSRDMYRRVISELAKHSRRSEREVAHAAIEMAQASHGYGLSGRAAERRAHVGFYLVDRGLSLLRRRVGYRTPVRQRVRDAICARPTLHYLTGIAAATIAILLVLLGEIAPGAALLGAIALLLLPVSQAAVDLINGFASSLVSPRRLPKLDFSDGIPDACATLVAVPALLLNERHVRELVMDLEIRYLANCDPNLSFALVTNSCDANERSDERHAVLHLCERLIRELNDRYGSAECTPFYLLHRFRAFNPAEGRWMGWERKRGKLHDLNQLLRGVRDRFPVKAGNVAALSRIRYVITLDSDTELPRDAGHRLVGTLAHPLNRAVIDPETKTVVEGYGILQPRISVSTQSATRSWLASLYSGDTGFDIYTRAVSDVYQDLFGEGNFTGKGIYEVDVFRESLEARFPANTLLSHDLIEGVFARAGLVSDIELVDDYPTHFTAYCRRKHRWMRGDWQVLRWLFNRVPDYHGRIVTNPLSAVSRWKIADNLRRTLLEPAMLAMLLASWFVLPGDPVAWTVATIGLLLAPAYWRLVMEMTRAPWWTAAFRLWAVNTLAGFLRVHLIVALHLTYLLHDTLLAVDATARALARMFVTHRRLLEWETAAEAALRTRGATDAYLRWSPWIAGCIAGVLALVRPEALAAAGPLIALWAVSRPVAAWLNQPPRAGTADLNGRDVTYLRDHALSTWSFFSEFSNERVNWLVPDFVRRDGQTANRLSPTNVAFLLNARIAAVHFGYLTLPEFVGQTRKTLDAVLRLRRYRGHLLNWYDAEDLTPLNPPFVSTVDSGNLVAALWALKQTALEWAREEPSSDALWDGITDVARKLGGIPDPATQALNERVLKARDHWRRSLPELEALVAHFVSASEGDANRWASELLLRLHQARAWCELGATMALGKQLLEIAATAGHLASEMDFEFLYDARRKVLSVGYDISAARVERSTYDLLASEARIASFVAIAKGDIPQECWFHLGRTHVAAHGHRVLISWTGTLFEYLMPALWLRHGRRTLVRETMRAAVAVQRAFARARRIPWGFSEAGHILPGSSEYGYAASGLPELALKPLDGDTIVVSPYSSYLAALENAPTALDNLRELERLGVVGRHGFFEAIDYSHGQPQIVEAWMAHHQGMILLATAELLFAHPFQRAFHAEPHVRATERLLDERIPPTMVADRPGQPKLLMPEKSAA